MGSEMCIRDRLEISPMRYWRKVILKAGESITLRPGELVLGRTYEEFTIPSDCAGKIEGRSSFARIGLGIHISGDFINPGYKGRMPLQLVNYSPNPIRLYPYIPICQLMLIKLSGKPDRLYGEEELQSKYMNDDGGPSYWWKDKRIKRLQDRLKECDVSLKIQDEILEKIGNQEPEVIERFEKFIEKLPIDDFQNSEVVLDKFLKHEQKQSKKEKLLRTLLEVLVWIFVSATGGSLFVKPFGTSHGIVWIFTLLILVFWVYYKSTHEPQEYLEEVSLEDKK